MSKPVVGRPTVAVIKIPIQTASKPSIASSKPGTASSKPATASSKPPSRCTTLRKSACCGRCTCGCDPTGPEARFFTTVQMFLFDITELIREHFSYLCTHHKMVNAIDPQFCTTFNRIDLTDLYDHWAKTYQIVKDFYKRKNQQLPQHYKDFTSLFYKVKYLRNMLAHSNKMTLTMCKIRKHIADISKYANGAKIHNWGQFKARWPDLGLT